MRHSDLSVIFTWGNSRGGKKIHVGFGGCCRKNKTLPDKEISSQHSERSVSAEMAFPFCAGTVVRVGRELMSHSELAPTAMQMS